MRWGADAGGSRRPPPSERSNVRATRFVAPVALALVTLAWRPALQHQPDGVELTAVRFFRGGQTTLIDGFCRVPFSILSPLSGGDAAYHVDVKVLDNSGNELYNDGWSESVSAGVLSMPGGSSIEPFKFIAKTGAYRIDVSVRDSASGSETSSSTTVSAFTERPEVSDLLLTSDLRRASPDDTVPHPGEIRKGALFITATTHPVLTPHLAKLYYYVEAYPAAGGAVTAVAHIVGAGDHEIIASAPDTTVVPAGGGILASGMDLTGLPPGEYHLQLVVKVGDSTVTRAAPFTMAGFATDSAVQATAGRRGAAADQFASATDAQLDSLYAPLVYLQTSNEQGVWNGLSRQGKINYLRAFWAKRGAKAEAAYYQAVAETNRRFGEGGAGRVPGWRTDRGRIFLKNGSPDEVLSRPLAAGTQPYEVWKYTRGKLRKYVFYDDTGFGHYELIYTNDTHEVSRPNWRDLLGQQAVQDVLSF